MSKKCIMPDFRKMYPDASEEVIAVLRQTERKMQYQEYDLKSEHIRVNQRNKAVTYVPSREDSWERLLSIDKQFPADQPSVEDEVICKIMYKQLHEALQLLAEDERYWALFGLELLGLYLRMRRNPRMDGERHSCHMIANAF